MWAIGVMSSRWHTVTAVTQHVLRNSWIDVSVWIQLSGNNAIFACASNMGKVLSAQYVFGLSSLLKSLKAIGQTFWNIGMWFRWAHLEHPLLKLRTDRGSWLVLYFKVISNTWALMKLPLNTKCRIVFSVPVPNVVCTRLISGPPKLSVGLFFILRQGA